MVKATKKDTGSFVYMKLKKHPCPKCGEIMKIVKMKKTVKAKSKEAAGFNFSAANVHLGEKVKFIWYEFKCPACLSMYKEESLKAIEAKAKKEDNEAKKAEKKVAKAEKKVAKAEKKAARTEKKAEKKTEKKAEKAEKDEQKENSNT